jgi:1-deoxy-D-xylulose-5-phosphate reductoisomerase
LRMGGTAPAVLNAANEVAVEAFLSGRISFLAIARIIRDVLDEHQPRPLEHIDEVLRADRWGRATANRKIDAPT